MSKAPSDDRIRTQALLAAADACEALAERERARVRGMVRVGQRVPLGRVSMAVECARAIRALAGGAPPPKRSSVATAARMEALFDAALTCHREAQRRIAEQDDRGAVAAARCGRAIIEMMEETT